MRRRFRADGSLVTSLARGVAVCLARATAGIVCCALVAACSGDPGAIDDHPTDDAGADAPAPTWSALYADYFGPGTAGHCGNSGCHLTSQSGFLCGTSAESCYQGMVEVGIIDPNDPTKSAMADPNESPLAWFGGGMPQDNPVPNPAARAAVAAWVAAGAQDN